MTICTICGSSAVSHDCPGPRVTAGGRPDGRQRRCRYLITLTPEHALGIEGWLSGRIDLVPAGAPAGVPLASMDAVFDDELAGIDQRLRSGGPPRYHAGGPA